MKIAIKFCGGCNPRIRRKKIVSKVEERCKECNFEIYESEENYDLILGLNGCHVACGLSSDLKENEELMIVGGLTFNGYRLKDEKELVEKIVNKINNKLKGGGKK